MSPKTSRREFLKSAGILTGSAVLAACAPKATPTSEAVEPTEAPEATAPPKETITIRIQAPAFAHWVGPEEGLVTFAVKEHEKTHPDVKLEVEETVYGEISKKTETGFVSGTLQDICFAHSRWYFYGCYKGIYMPVDDLIASAPPDDFDDFFPLWMEAQTFEGKQYCLPSDAKAGPFTTCHYNKDLLEETGVTEPEEGWTFDDLKEMAIKIADQDKGIFGAYWPLPDIHRLQNYTRYFGEPTLDDTSSSLVVDDGKTFRLSTPTIEEAAQLYLDLSQNYRAIPMAADMIEEGLFVAGKLGFEFGTVANYYLTTKATVGGKFEMGQVMAPTGPQGRSGTVCLGNQWMINSDSEYPEEAWEVMKTFTSYEVCVYSAMAPRGIEPGRRLAWSDPRVLAGCPLFEKHISIMDTIAEPMPMPWNLRYVEANDVYKNESDLIWQGQESWDGYAPVVEERVQAIFDLDRPPKAAQA